MCRISVHRDRALGQCPGLSDYAEVIRKRDRESCPLPMSLKMWRPPECEWTGTHLSQGEWKWWARVLNDFTCMWHFLSARLTVTLKIGQAWDISHPELNENWQVSQLRFLTVAHTLLLTWPWRFQPDKEMLTMSSGRVLLPRRVKPSNTQNPMVW